MNTCNKTNASEKNSDSSSSGDRPTSPEPKIITGWEHSVYAHRNTDRYAYMGKDDNGEPEWVDWGSKNSRKQ